MAIEIKMPQLSDTMDRGKILSWLKKEGEEIERGDTLAEVETDKANLEIESFHKGYLLKIVIPEGTEAKVGETIAYIGEKGEKIPVKKERASRVGAERSAPQEQEGAAIQPAPKADLKELSSVPTNKKAGGASPSPERIKASPLAKRIAKEHNLELTLIEGTGPGGRITKRDVEKFLASSAPPAAETAEISASSAQSEILGIQPSLEELSKMRQTIANRMQQSVREIPHFYLFEEITMDNLINLREALKEKEDYKGISYNHFVIKASALALAKEKRVNSSIKEGKLYSPSSINIGIVTALPDGLLIPVLHNVDKMSLKDIVFEAQALIERARAGRPTSKDLSGATFSISNLGMFGIDSFTAIISPGQGAILAVGAIKKKPAVINDKVVPSFAMSVALSVDHRIIDGAMGANFLRALKKNLEQPALLFA